MRRFQLRILIRPYLPFSLLHIQARSFAAPCPTYRSNTHDILKAQLKFELSNRKRAKSDPKPSWIVQWQYWNYAINLAKSHLHSIRKAIEHLLTPCASEHHRITSAASVPGGTTSSIVSSLNFKSSSTGTKSLIFVKMTGAAITKLPANNVQLAAKLFM